MAKDKIIGQIYETSDYSKFKRLEGNRKVITARVKKIIDSIKRVGYVKAPIIVNEQYQIIDGQGRFEALKKLGLLVKMGQMQANLIPVTTMQQAFEAIEIIYNNRSRKHVYIKTNYLKALDDKYSWYRNKYGNRYED